ncbi:MAG: fdrA domain protein [Betaproteobacteria bacterium]|nr:fdrA domain protein [Betaproteobacteria bacterium]MBV9362413.1 fdrA domain protein [Betaproteobacteria bacterium]
MMPMKLEDLLRTKPVFVNVGVRSFGDSLREAGYQVIHVDWSPPAGGDQKMAELLDDLL